MTTGPAARRWKVGVVGAGSMSAENHLPALLALPDMEVTWLTDVDATRLKRIAAAYRVREVAPAPSAWPGDTELVILSTPYGTRGRWFEAFPKTLRGVYVEKPFARTTAEHDEACAAFPRGALAVGLQRRSSSSVAVMRALVERGALGPLQAVRVEHGSPRVATGGRYLGQPGIAGGGVLAEVGVHALDAALYASCATEVVFERVRMELEDGLDVHTDAAGRLTTAAGDTVPIELIVTQLGHTTMTITFEFRHAWAVFDLFAATPPRILLGSREVPAVDLVVPEARVETSSQMLARHYDAFRRAVASGEPGIASAESTRLTTRAMELLYQGGAA